MPALLCTRDLLRFAVLKSNRFWPFSALNRRAYDLALAVFVTTCRSCPCVKSVYLRHALRGENFKPGLSDIDLTVVIDAGLDRKTEFSFLRRFRRRIGFLSRVFPMIGEVEILNAAQLQSWTRFGLEGQSARQWQLLAGKDTVVDVRPPEPARFAIETLNYACWFYIWHMARAFVQRQCGAYLSVQDMKRVQRKIKRCMSAIGVDESSAGIQGPTSPGEVDDHAAILLRTLQYLEAGLRNIESDVDPPVSRRDAWLVGRVRPNSTRQDLILEEPDFEPWRKVVHSAYLDPRNVLFVVLRDNVVSMDSLRCVNWIRVELGGTDIRPVVLTRRMFAYMIRFIIPYEHSYVARNVELVFGGDLVSEIAIPDGACLFWELFAYTPNALMFPTSEVFLLGSVEDPKFRAELLHAVNRMLGLKLQLDGGKALRTPEETLASYSAAYPDQADRLRTLKTDLSRGSDDRRGWFDLMRDLTDDIHTALSNEVRH